MDCLDIQEAMELYPDQISPSTVKLWLERARRMEEFYDRIDWEFLRDVEYIRDADDRISTRRELKRKRSRKQRV
jgi:hypothetical protein